MNSVKNKKVYDKYIQTLSSKEIEEKVNSLAKRLSRQRICHEHKLISHMNPKLQTKLTSLLKLEELRNTKLEDAIKIVNKVPFLTWIRKEDPERQTQGPLYKGEKSKRHDFYSESDTLQLKYENMDKTVILTGMTQAFIHEAMSQFCSTRSYYNKNQQSCKKVGANEFWTALEADSPQSALAFKKLTRNKKREMDEKRVFTYKQEKKRVRIVMQSEDFYTLLVDAMTEKKNLQFNRRLVNPHSGIFPELCSRDFLTKNVFPNENYQLSLLKVSKILYFPVEVSTVKASDYKEWETAVDDIVSEQRSKTSEINDGSSIKDLIQTTEQGIQAENQTEEIVAETDHPKQQTFKGNYLKESKRQMNSDEQRHTNEEKLEADSSDRQMNQLRSSPPQCKHREAENQQIDTDTERLRNSRQQKQLQPINLCQTADGSWGPKQLKLVLKWDSPCQTDSPQIRFTAMKKLEVNYKKRNKHREKLAPNIPDEFREIAAEDLFRSKFFQNIEHMFAKNNLKNRYF